MDFNRLGIFALLLACQPGTAQTPSESVNLGVEVFVDQCVTSAAGVACRTMTLVNKFHQISIPLSVCEPVNGGGKMCSGMWTSTVTLPPNTYTAAVTAAKLVNGYSETSYSISSEVGLTLTATTPQTFLDVGSTPSIIGIVGSVGDPVSTSDPTVTQLPLVLVTDPNSAVTSGDLMDLGRTMVEHRLNR